MAEYGFGRNAQFGTDFHIAQSLNTGEEEHLSCSWWKFGNGCGQGTYVLSGDRLILWRRRSIDNEVQLLDAGYERCDPFPALKINGEIAPGANDIAVELRSIRQPFASLPKTEKRLLDEVLGRGM